MTKFYQTISVEKELPEESYNGYFCYDNLGNMREAYYFIPHKKWCLISNGSVIEVSYWLKEISIHELMVECMEDYNEHCTEFALRHEGHNSLSEKDFVIKFLNQQSK